MDSEKSHKLANKFECKYCDYVTCKKADYTKHLSTDKHKNRINDSKNGEMIVEKSQKVAEYKCKCGKTYKYDSGYYRHKKICDGRQTSNDDNNCKKDTIEPNTETVETGNKDEVIKYLLEVIKNGTNNTTNNTNMNNSNNMNSNNNNNNKTFNLQFFLNETCKDAMNLMDFVQDIVLTLNDLEETGRIGFAEGISKIINKRLKALDVTQRPIHCSDLKRETFYIKNENKWEKEECDNPILTKAVKHIAGKNMMQIFDWQKAHPDYNDPETRTSDKYMKMLTNVMSGGTEEEIQENYEKIVKNIIKETGIDKEKFLI